MCIGRVDGRIWVDSVGGAWRPHAATDILKVGSGPMQLEEGGQNLWPRT